MLLIYETGTALLNEPNLSAAIMLVFMAVFFFHFVVSIVVSVFKL